MSMSPVLFWILCCCRCLGNIMLNIAKMTYLLGLSVILCNRSRGNKGGVYLVRRASRDNATQAWMPHRKEEMAHLSSKLASSSLTWHWLMLTAVLLLHSCPTWLVPDLVSGMELTTPPSFLVHTEMLLCLWNQYILSFMLQQIGSTNQWTSL